MKPLSLFDNLDDIQPGAFRPAGGRKSRSVLSKHAANHPAFGLDDRMTIVLFAGMGGGCDGLEDAGYHVHVAINHDPVAVAVHEKRHPHTKHLRCDVFEAEPREVTRGRGVRVLHASPDCTHFSVAKGSKPVSKRRRSLSWVICRWAGTVRPETITMENVQEIMTWGPLIAKRDPATGRVLKLDETVAAKGERVPVQEQWLIPDPRHKGRIWRAWLKHLRGLGYSFEHRVLVCADYGVPTIRKRFFGVAQADGRPIAWPERTHAPRKDAKRLGLKPWVGAHTIIDWSLPVKSIFGRKKPLAEATLRRTARGVMRYVVNAAKPFIVPITHSGDRRGTERVHDSHDPLRALTTAHRGELAVVAPHLATMRNSRQPLGAADEPAHALTAQGAGIALVGASLGAAIVGAGGRAAQSEPRGMEDPLGSTTTKEDRVLVAASLVQTGYGERKGQAPRTLDIEVPLGAQVAGGKHALVAASLVGLAHGDSGKGGVNREYDLADPAKTFHAGGGNAALIAAFMAQHNGDPRDDGRNEARPGRTADDPAGSFTTSPQLGVTAAFLAQHNTGEPGRPAEEPVSTIVTLGSTQGVVAASLQRQFGASIGADVGEPAPTATVGGSGKTALVAATLGNMHGTNVDGRPANEPLSTVSAGGSHAHLILGFLQHYFGSGKQDDDVRQPIGALTGKARYGLVEVMVRGVPHYIDDIGMRMLEPEEGAAAHGFKSGSLPSEITIDGKTRRLTKTEKYHLVGNSVPPKMIQLLAECNVRPAFAEAAE